MSRDGVQIDVAELGQNCGKNRAKIGRKCGKIAAACLNSFVARSPHPALPPRHTAADRRARPRRVTELQHHRVARLPHCDNLPRAKPPRHRTATPRCTKATLPNRTQSGAIVAAIDCIAVALIPPQSTRLSAGATQPAATRHNPEHVMQFISPPSPYLIAVNLPDTLAPLAPFAPVAALALAVALAAAFASALSR